jgi:predicted RNA-binding protein associated with RNAse of E/G family
VLQLHRSGDWYSVWKLMDGCELLGWHINFDEPVSRRADGFDVNDLQLDLLVAPDGTSRWKDVEDLAPALATGRMDRAQLVAVLEAAADVASALAVDDRWWSPWDEWLPAATDPSDGVRRPH